MGWELTWGGGGGGKCCFGGVEIDFGSKTWLWERRGTVNECMRRRVKRILEKGSWGVFGGVKVGGL